MSSINQSCFFRHQKQNFRKNPGLKLKPQARGRFKKLVILTPRKPNSALRKVGKINLFNKKRVQTKIPGSGTQPMKYSIVLVRGNGYRDTPGVKYSLIRGGLECLPLFEKTRRRSIYGVKNMNKLRMPRYLKK